MSFFMTRTRPAPDSKPPVKEHLLMNTFTYSTANIPAKDVVAISSLLAVFGWRLNARWIMRNHPSGKNIDVTMIDIDGPGVAEAWHAPEAHIRIAVSDDVRKQVEWLITRPIRAYGANGVVVLLNSIAEVLASGAAITPAPAPVELAPEVPAATAEAVQKVPSVPAVAAPPPLSMNKWRAPEAVVLPDLIDMRTGRTISPVPVNHNAKAALMESPKPPAPPAIVVRPKPEVSLPAPTVVDAPKGEAAALSPMATVTPTPVVVAAPATVAAPAVQAAQAASTEPAISEQSTIDDNASAAWWGTAAITVESASPASSVEAAIALPQLLRDIKKSGSTGVLEIDGLPGVCLLPGRRTFYTTAPLFRIEAAMTAHIKASFRPCASEDEARQLAGAHESRASNLDKLFWASALIAPAPLPSAFAEGPIRLKGWPPVNTTSGSNKYLRYATLLSGGALTAEQLATLTGSDLKEVTVFLQACAELELLEAAEAQLRVITSAPRAGSGKGILRSIIEQLAPPKL
jgi:hypothetical protein